MTTMIRTLHLAHAPDVTIPVRIFTPVRETLDWSCRVEISWPDDPVGRNIIGIDAIQAFELALQFIGTELYMSDFHRQRHLVWLERGQGYGFPVPVVIRDLLVGDDRKRFG